MIRYQVTMDEWQRAECRRSELPFSLQVRAGLSLLQLKDSAVKMTRDEANRLVFQARVKAEGLGVK